MKLTLSKLKVDGLHYWVVVGRSGSSDAHDGAAEQGKTQTATYYVLYKHYINMHALYINTTIRQNVKEKTIVLAPALKRKPDCSRNCHV